jgi:hypothetical protein
VKFRIYQAVILLGIATCGFVLARITRRPWLVGIGGALVLMGLFLILDKVGP